MAKLIKKTVSVGTKKGKKTMLSERPDHKQDVITLISRVLIQQKKRTGLAHRPIVKRIGMKDIVITPQSEITPIVIEASPNHIRYISPQQRKIANLLKKMPFADIRRIGIDILDE